MAGPRGLDGEREGVQGRGGQGKEGRVRGGLGEGSVTAERRGGRSFRKPIPRIGSPLIHTLNECDEYRRQQH